MVSNHKPSSSNDAARPGLTLVRGNQSEALVDVLAQRLAAQARAGHRLDPATVVVPNPNVETYLRLALCERHGVAAGLDFLRLETLAARAAGDRREVQIVDRALLQAGLLALFHDPIRLETPELAPVRAYLGGDDNDGGLDLRRVQLSERLAALLEGYQWSRPGLVLGWLREADPLAPDPSVNPELSFQGALFRALLAKGGLLREPSSLSATRRPLTPLVSRLLDPKRPLTLPGHRGAIHLFGLSTFGRLFHHLLARLSLDHPVVVYLLDPSQHYWDDLLAEGPAIADAVGEDPLGFAEQPCLPLALWGKAGGEHLRLLRELVGGAELLDEEVFRAPARDTLLGRVQDDLLEARPPAEIEPFARADEVRPPASLHALACPSLRREVEAVADRIWAAMAKPVPGASGEPLRFHEIAVLVPPSARDRYLPMIAQVFAAHHRLPHTTADLSFVAGSPLAQATQLLLDLPFGRFTRAELLRLLTHPAFDREAALGPGGGEVDASRFADLAEAAGVYFGRDDADLAGTYLPPDTTHWAQGLDRLALGQALGGARTGEPELFYRCDTGPGGARALLAEDLGAESPQTARALGLLVSSLLHDLGVLREGRAPLSVWAHRLHRLLSAYLRVDPERPGDARDHLRILGTLDTLRDLELPARGPEGAPATEVSGRVACALFSRALAALGGQQGPYLAEGVVVSTFLPMRAIPFRAIFVLGLGEGVFPGPARRDPLDLRATRVAGDLTPAERDRQAFLETLLSARETLILSWIYREETTGDLLAPSSLLLDLLEVLRPLLPAEALRLPSRGKDGQISAGAFFERIPLRRREDPATRLPEARAEQEAARLGEALGVPAGLPVREALAGLAQAAAGPGFTPDEQATLETLLALAPCPEAVAGGGGPAALSAERDTAAPGVPDAAPAPIKATRATPRVLGRGDLRAFLDSPLQGAGRARLHLREEDLGASGEVEDEPVTRDTLQRYSFLHGGLEATLRDLAWDSKPATTRAAAERVLALARLAQARGGPRGVFARTTLGADLATLLVWRAAIIEATAGPIRRIHLGSARESAHVDAPHLPALSLPAASETGTPITLQGTTGLLASGADDLICPVSRDRLDSLARLRALLSGLLDHLLLSASGLAELSAPEGRRLQIVGTKIKSPAPPIDLDALPPLAQIVASLSLDALPLLRETLHLAPIGREAACALLAGLAAEIFSAAHDHLLPIDVIARLVNKTDTGFALELETDALRAAIEATRLQNDRFGGPPRSAYGPIPAPFAYPFVEADAGTAELIERRFGPLLALVSFADPTCEAP